MGVCTKIVVLVKICEGKFGGFVGMYYLCSRKLRGLCPWMMLCMAEPCVKFRVDET